MRTTILLGCLLIVLTLTSLVVPANEGTRTSVSPPNLSWRELKGGSAIGGVVMISVMVTRDRGPFKTGDVILRVGANQVTAKLSVIKENVSLYRDGQKLEVRIDRPISVENRVVGWVTQRDEESPAKRGDVITKIDGRTFASGTEYLALSRNANETISFIRDGIDQTRPVEREGYGALAADVVDCVGPYISGYCVSQSLCAVQPPPPTMPSNFCGMVQGDSQNPQIEGGCCTIYR